MRELLTFKASTSDAAPLSSIWLTFMLIRDQKLKLREKSSAASERLNFKVPAKEKAPLFLILFPLQSDCIRIQITSEIEIFERAIGLQNFCQRYSTFIFNLTSFYVQCTSKTQIT